jgi:ATP-dependent DNA helicase HFM1/MER3
MVIADCFRVPGMITRHSKGKPSMVFCMTRKSAARTATALAAMWNQSPAVQKPWSAPNNVIAVKDADLRSMLPVKYQSVADSY